MGLSFKDTLVFRFKEGNLQPVKHPHIPSFDTLLCIERQKEEARRNTLKLVKGLPSHDALLWGDRGTGKSSLVKSMLGLFGKDGLRLIQVYKMDIEHVSDLYEPLREAKEKFILFFDDLSFEEGDERVNVLKSLMDGDVEERPENVVIYATSNSRKLGLGHTVDEKFPEESRACVLSLLERFGLRLGFFTFGKDDYLKIVRHYAEIRDIKMERIEETSLEWARNRGGFSGRLAYQFIKELEGNELGELHNAP
ncbi:MAG: ATP-binding protein [Aquificaceae bacterium]